jgi:hypothetical protein
MVIGHTSAVHNLSFNSSDRAMISAEEQAGLFLWNLELDDLLQRGCKHLHNYLNTNPNVSEQDSHLCS